VRKVLYFQKLSKFRKVGLLLSENEVLRGFRKIKILENNLKDLGCQARVSQGSKQVLGGER
jgi:hypothetical protein